MPGIDSIITAAKEIARAIQEGQPAKPPRPLSLEDALLREPIENQGGYTVIPEETPRRLLRPVMARVVATRWITKYRPVEAGIDSSSRRIDTSIVSIIIAGAAASAPGAYPLAETPSLARDTGGPGNIILVGAGSPSRPPFLALSPAGYSYEDYSAEQAMDEARLVLENWLLRGPIAGWVREARSRGRTPVVLIDGPVVPVTMAFQGAPRTAGDHRYAEAWRALAGERLEAVRRLERLGALVIGVVKRIDKSTILSRVAHGLEGLRGVEPGRTGDQAVLYMCTRRLLREGRARPGRFYSSPTLRIVITGRGLEQPLVKHVEYLVLPPGKWLPPASGSRFYRIEYLDATARALASAGARGSYPVVAASLYRGSLEPLVIAASDRRSKQTTRALRDLVVASMRRAGIPLTYEAEIEVRIA